MARQRRQRVLAVACHPTPSLSLLPGLIGGFLLLQGQAPAPALAETRSAGKAAAEAQATRAGMQALRLQPGVAAVGLQQQQAAAQAGWRPAEGCGEVLGVHSGGPEVKDGIAPC